LYLRNSMLQLNNLFPLFDQLHLQHGASTLNAIYGAGKIENPKVLLVFMNPTAKNISAGKDWKGLKAPWLGTKHVWRLLSPLGLLTNKDLINQTQIIKPDEWTLEFAEQLYTSVASDSVYITNIAKCTQEDARPLPNNLFKEYLPSMLEEIYLTNPEYIFCFGNQVSSILLSKPISVSQFTNNEFAELIIKDKTFKVYPTYYPVGQGMRNMGKAINKIEKILNKKE